MPKRRNKQLNKYNVDIIKNYVMPLTSKIEKLAVFVCYGYVSQTPDIYEGTGQNIFFDELFHCYAKRRRIDSISSFLRAMGLTRVNRYEFKQLLDFGLPRCDNINIPYYKDGKKIILTLKNFPPVFLTEEKDSTGKLLGEYVNVLAWDPIMHDYFSSLTHDVSRKLELLTSRQFNLGLRLINYFRENRKRLRGKVLVRNLSRDNVDEVLKIDTVREPAQRDQVRNAALLKAKQVGLLNGYKLFLESGIYHQPSPDVVLASVEDFNNISNRELLLVKQARDPDMVTLVFNSDSYK